jgi:rod shape-determining protein MreC
MKPKNERYKVALVCLALLVAPLFSMYFHGRTERGQTVVESVLVSVTAPGQSAMHSVLYAAVGWWKRYVYLMDTEAQNEELRDAVADLQMVASRARGLEEEVLRLRAMLEFRQEHRELTLKAGQVVGRETSPFFAVSRVTLDQGGSDGVAVNMPVVTAAGVVGRVERVAGRFCDVMLLTDTRSRIDVQVAGKGVSGTLVGTGDGLPVFRYPYQDAALGAGDMLITTGHDKTFPKGLAVGTVGDPAVRQVGQQLEVGVEPAVRFSGVQEVFVVVAAGSEAPAGKEQGVPARGEAVP